MTKRAPAHHAPEETLTALDEVAGLLGEWSERLGAHDPPPYPLEVGSLVARAHALVERLRDRPRLIHHGVPEMGADGHGPYRVALTELLGVLLSRIDDVVGPDGRKAATAARNYLETLEDLVAVLRDALIHCPLECCRKLWTDLRRAHAAIARALVAVLVPQGSRPSAAEERAPPAATVVATTVALSHAPPASRAPAGREVSLVM